MAIWLAFTVTAKIHSCYDTHLTRSDGEKNALGMIKSNRNRASPAFSCHLPPVHFPGVRYPTKASLEKCIDFNGVLFASSAPHSLCLTHLFSHLSFFFSRELCLHAAFPITVGVDAGQV